MYIVYDICALAAHFNPTARFRFNLYTYAGSECEPCQPCEAGRQIWFLSLRCHQTRLENPQALVREFCQLNTSVLPATFD